MEEKTVRNWRVLSSEYISRKPWFTVRREKVELANGAIIPDYNVLEYPAWICVVAIDVQGRMLIERQYRHGLGRVGNELCAGVVDDTDASFLEAAKRELLEETGYGNGEWSEFMQVCANPGTHNNMTYCFLALNVEKMAEPNLENTEDIEVKFMEKNEVHKLLAANGFDQAIHAAALWKYFAENR